MNIPSKIVFATLLLAGAAPVTADNMVRKPGAEPSTNPARTHNSSAIARLSYCRHANCLDTLNVGAFVGQWLATAPKQSSDLDFWVRSFTGARCFSALWDASAVAKTGTARTTGSDQRARLAASALPARLEPLRPRYCAMN